VGIESCTDHNMQRSCVTILAFGAAAIATIAWAGHELPVYPSYYPHEIKLSTVAPDQAPQALKDGKIQAYIGPGLKFSGTPSIDIQAVESLGSFVTVRSNPRSPRAVEEGQACDVAGAVMHALATEDDMVLHPYPVTPFHGDYLYHADLAAAAKVRFAAAALSIDDLKIKASGDLRQRHPRWSTSDNDWDAEIEEVDAGALMSDAAFVVDGLITPPWVRTGWFQAERLLRDSLDDADRKQRVESLLAQLKTGDFTGLADRINLERGLVTALSSGCRKVVAGYTVRREYANVEYTVGIENIGYDALAGLHSPMFIRTVKLKDFPWNGWLALGIASSPDSAWNPIGGMTDPFGRMMGFALNDPPLLPSACDAGWMPNRISDLPSSHGQ